MIFGGLRVTPCARGPSADVRRGGAGERHTWGGTTRVRGWGEAHLEEWAYDGDGTAGRVFYGLRPTGMGGAATIGMHMGMRGDTPQTDVAQRLAFTPNTATAAGKRDNGDDDKRGDPARFDEE